MEIQRMARQAFSNMLEPEYNQLLKGRFFQALQVKWQRKLGAPKPEESFQDLYDHARLMEQYEKQYSDTVAVCNESQIQKLKQPTKNPGPGGAKPKSRTQTPATPSSTASPAPSPQPSGFKRKYSCHQCHEVGHLACNCPHQFKTSKPPEAPGRSDNSRSCVAAVEANYIADDLTVAQLEELLSRRRLAEEQEGLKSNLGAVSAVTASATEIGAVGPTLFLDVSIEGEKVEAMVDCASPTTIISRSLLHSVAKNM